MTRDGLKNSNGLIYVQVGGEEGSFMAAGFYQAEPKDLAVLRQAIAANQSDWLTLEATLASAGLLLDRNSGLTRSPKGFEAYAASPVGGTLKLRHLVVTRPIPAERLGQIGLIDDILEFTTLILPLLHFGWRALDRARTSA